MQKQKQRLLRGILVGLPLLFSVLLAAAAEDAVPQADGTASPKEKQRKGIVTAGVLNVRARPGFRYEVVAQLHRGDIVVIVKEQDKWYGIVPPENARAWVASQFVSSEGEITGDNLRVRSGPGLVFTRYGMLPKGARVRCIGEPTNGWQRIVPPKNAVVWVAKEYVAAEPTPVRRQQAGVASETTGQGEQTTKEETPAQPAPVKPQATKKTSAAKESKEQTPSAGTPTAPAGPGEAARKDQGKGAEASAPEPEPPAVPAPDAETVSRPGAEVPSDEKEAGVEEAQPVRVVRQGVIVPLDAARRSSFATHVLCEKTETVLKPLCYLKAAGPDIDLTEWEYRAVNVYGQEVRYKGWSRPTVVVDGVQLILP